MLQARWARPLALLSVTLLSLSAAGAQEAPEKEGTPDRFVTEIQLAVDRTALGKRKLDSGVGPLLAAALTERGRNVSGAAVEVEVRSLEDIRVRFPAEKVRDGHLVSFVRQGVFEVRHLDSVRTSLNGEGRYVLQAFTTQDAKGSSVQMSFKEVNSGRSVPIPYVLERSPKIADNSDLEPGSAAPQLSAVATGAGQPNTPPTGFTGGGVRVQLSAKATQRLQRLTRKPGRLLAVVLDGELMEITSFYNPPQPKQKGRKRQEADVEQPGQTFVLTGNFRSMDEVEALAKVLNSDPLPVPVKLINKRVEAD